MRKKVYILSYLILFLAPAVLRAQYEGKIRGFVSDSLSGEPLAFANVLIEELNYGASTDEKGFFLMTNIPPNKYYDVLVSYVGYASERLKIFVGKRKITELHFLLKPASVWLNTVEKVGEKVVEENTADLGLERIAVKDLETVPRGVEADVLRSLQYLPGVSSAGDISARYNVRGGASNQNLILLDNVTLYNPFHAFGIFGVIDPEIINNVEFYKSGFPVEHGGRISSIMKITAKEGNKFHYGAKASVSFLTAKAYAEGPIPHGSFYIDGRKSYSNSILKKFLGEKNIPFDFYDYAFKVTYHNPSKKFIDNSKWTLHGFFSKDATKNIGGIKEKFSWRNSLIGLKRFQVYSTPLYSELCLSLSDSKGEILPGGARSREKKNEVHDFSLRMDFHYIYDSSDELGVGFSFKAIRTRLSFLNPTGVKSDINDFGANISIYGKYLFRNNKKYGLDLGLRVNLEGLKDRGNFFIEPRINFTYLLSKTFKLKAAFGSYQQGITTLTDESDVVPLFEPWFLTPGYLTPARAEHFNFGVFTNFSKSVIFNAELYLKSMQHLPEINKEKKLPEQPDLVEASGESYGVESFLRILLPPIRFTASYSWAYSYKINDGRKYFPNYDSRNTVKLFLEFNAGKGWYFTSAWIFHSGRPFTPTVGYYDKFYFDHPGFGDWEIYESYLPFLILGEKNASRLPAYHRLDMSLMKNFAIGRYKFNFNVSIINVYDRKNVFYFERDTGKRVNMLPFLPTATLKVEI